MILEFLLFLGAPGRPASAAAAAIEASAPVQEAFGKIDDILARESRGDLDSGQVRALDREAQDLLEKTLSRAGIAAARPLEEIALDEDRPIKARVWAVNGLQIVGSGGSLKALDAILTNKDAPDVLRLEAASAVGGFAGPAEPRSRILCAALGEEGLPARLSRQCLREISLLGCPEPSALEALLRRWGRRPSVAVAEKELPLAFEALSRSPAPETTRVLLGLVGFYRRGSPERLGTLELLRGFAGELGRFPGEARQALADALLEETKNPKTEVLILGMFGRVADKSSIPMLDRFLDHPSPEVATAACRDIERLGVSKRDILLKCASRSTRAASTP